MYRSDAVPVARITVNYQLELLQSKPPVKAALVVTYLQFPVQVCFPCSAGPCRVSPSTTPSMQRQPVQRQPVDDAHRHRHHRQPCGFNNSIDYYDAVYLLFVVPRGVGGE